MISNLSFFYFTLINVYEFLMDHLLIDWTRRFCEQLFLLIFLTQLGTFFYFIIDVKNVLLRVKRRASCACRAKTFCIFWSHSWLGIYFLDFFSPSLNLKRSLNLNENQDWTSIACEKNPFFSTDTRGNHPDSTVFQTLSPCIFRKNAILTCLWG